MAQPGNTFILDLSTYKDKVGARVDPGRYRVVVDDAEMDKSKAGNQMVNVWLRIVGGEFDGATLTDRLTITEKALFRVVGFMQGIGLPTPKKRLQIDLRQFIGKTLDVDVDDGDPYNGRVKTEVRGYIRVAGAKNAKASDDTSASVEDLPDPEEGEGTDEAELPEIASEDPWQPLAPGTPDAEADEAPDPEEDPAPPKAKKKKAAPAEESEEVDLDSLDLG